MHLADIRSLCRGPSGILIVLSYYSCVFCMCKFFLGVSWSSRGDGMGVDLQMRCVVGMIWGWQILCFCDFFFLDLVSVCFVLFVD